MKQTSRYSSIPPAERLPEWLRRPIGNASDLEAVQGVVKQQRLRRHRHLSAGWPNLHPQLRLLPGR